MTELRRFNAVPKIIGQDMNVEFEAADEGQWVQADGALTLVRELEGMLFRAVVELEYVRSVENCKSGLCASAEGAEIIEQGMRLLGIKDLDEIAFAFRVRAQH